MTRWRQLVWFIGSLINSTVVIAASHHPQQFLESIRNTEEEGTQIVTHFCANCHAIKPLIELGAPKMHQDCDWHLRIKQGLDGLLKHTAEGYGAMPARGGCFECSDLQLKLAILAMLPIPDAKIINKTDS
jgi:cytochrome c5